MIRHRLSTVSDFARQGYHLRLTCRSCGHVIDANAVEMRRDLHRRKMSLQIDAIEQRAKCSVCGERKARVSAVVAEW